jgi:hypothetical protein
MASEERANFGIGIYFFESATMTTLCAEIGIGAFHRILRRNTNSEEGARCHIYT